MVFKSLNPFYGIIETKKFPHARTLRTSLWQKLWDAFGIIAGNDDHPGIMHYSTLFIIAPIDYLVSVAWKGIDYGMNSDDDLAGFCATILLMLVGPFQLAYYGAAAAITLVAAPIVGVVHLFSKVSNFFSQGYDSEQALQEIKGTTSFTEPNRYRQRSEPRNNVLMSLQESLNRHQLTPDDIEVTHIKKRRNENHYSFIFSKKEAAKHGSQDYKFETLMPSDVVTEAASRKYLAPFFRLNIAKVTEYCEDLDQRENRNIVDMFTS